MPAHSLLHPRLRQVPPLTHTWFFLPGPAAPARDSDSPTHLPGASRPAPRTAPPAARATTRPTRTFVHGATLHLAALQHLPFGPHGAPHRRLSNPPPCYPASSHATAWTRPFDQFTSTASRCTSWPIPIPVTGSRRRATAIVDVPARHPAGDSTAVRSGSHLDDTCRGPGGSAPRVRVNKPLNRPVPQQAPRDPLKPLVRGHPTRALLGRRSTSPSTDQCHDKPLERGHPTRRAAQVGRVPPQTTPLLSVWGCEWGPTPLSSLTSHYGNER
jgi:hypothetical protein